MQHQQESWSSETRAISLEYVGSASVLNCMLMLMLLLLKKQLCGLGNLDGIICQDSDYPELHQAVEHRQEATVTTSLKKSRHPVSMATGRSCCVPC